MSMVGLVEMDTRDSSLAFASDAGLSFPSALDQTGKLLYDQGLNGLPATFFLRADGSIAHRQIGPISVVRRPTTRWFPSTSTWRCRERARERTDVVSRPRRAEGGVGVSEPASEPMWCHGRAERVRCRRERAGERTDVVSRPRRAECEVSA
ncbi:MAG: hypothetical protein WKF47_03245 [Geodermatophilaceae bacterium]